MSTSPIPLSRSARRLEFRLFGDIDPAPKKEWLVSRFIGVGELSCMFGPPGGAKSLAAGDLAAHVAAGRDWFGRTVSQGNVLYIACERAVLVRRRLAAWRLHHGINELPLAVVSETIDLRSSPEDAYAVIDCARDVRDQVGGELHLIQIDTASRAMAGGDENSSKDMGAFVNNLALIQKATGAHVMVLHHVPLDSQDRMRGHGALLAACDTTIRLERSGDIRTGTVIKTNDGDEGERVAFTIASVELCRDEETGDITTAPVAVPVEGEMARQPSHPARMPKAAQIALRALAEAINEQGDIPPASNHIPNNVRAVPEAIWRKQAYLRGISTGEERAKQAAFKRGSEHLIGIGRVGFWDELAWLAQ